MTQSCKLKVHRANSQTILHQLDFPEILFTTTTFSFSFSSLKIIYF